MIVRVANVIFSAFSAENLDGPIRDDFIRIHVERNPCARLVHINDKLLVPPALDYLVRSLNDCTRSLGIDQFQVAVCRRSGLFDHSDRSN